MSAVRSSIRRSVIARTSIPSMPSVPLIRASPSLASSSTGVSPAAARASAAGIRVPSASRTSPSPISARAQCESGARSPEQPSDPYSRTTGVIPDDSSAAISSAVSRPDPGVPGRQRREAEQHQRPDHLALDLGPGPRCVGADQRALQLLAHLGRDVPGRQCAEPRRDAVRRVGRGRQPLDHSAGLLDGRHRLRGQRHRRPTTCHLDHVGDRHRPHVHLHRHGPMQLLRGHRAAEGRAVEPSRMRD